MKILSIFLCLRRRGRCRRRLHGRHVLATNDHNFPKEMISQTLWISSSSHTLIFGTRRRKSSISWQQNTALVVVRESEKWEVFLGFWGYFNQPTNPHPTPGVNNDVMPRDKNPQLNLWSQLTGLFFGAMGASAQKMHKTQRN